MSDLPHTTSSSLDAMWRRLYRTLHDLVHQEIVRIFGQSYNAGTWDASSTSGTLPAVVGGRSVAAASVRWEPIGSADGSMLVDSSGSPIMALAPSPV